MRDEQIPLGSEWLHFKGDKMVIKAIAKHTETLEPMIIYEHKNELWARPISNFLSSEKIIDRKENKTGQTYRFEQIKKKEE